MTVQVADGNGGFDTQAIAVTVTNVNEAPVITSGAAVNAAENQTSVTTVTSSDVDGGAPVYSINGGADAALFSINPTTGVLSFNSAPNFEAPADAGANNVYNVTVQVADGNGGTATQAIAVTVTNVNEAPVNTVPGAQATSQGATLVFSSANGNAITIADADAGAASLQVTLTATSGTLTLGGTAGLAFTGGANGSATMTFTGSVASINTALNGLAFAPTAGYTGSATLQIVTNDQGNSGSGGALADTDVVPISVTSASLWVSSVGSASVPPGAGGTSWTDGQVVSFGNPNLALGAGTTGGTFSSVFNIDAFAADGDANINGLHRVSRAVTIGSGGNTISLQAGDVLLTTAASETLGGVAVTNRQSCCSVPTTAGDYSAARSPCCSDDPADGKIRRLDPGRDADGRRRGDSGVRRVPVRAQGATHEKHIWRFTPSGAGAGTTSGTLTQFIDGATANSLKRCMASSWSSRPRRWAGKPQCRRASCCCLWNPTAAAAAWATTGSW